MHIAEITFRFADGTDDRPATSAIYTWTAALLKNGQSLGREHPFARTNDAYHVWLTLPECDSLAPCHSREAVLHAEEHLREVGLREMDASIRGEDPESASPCRCEKRGSLILYTHCLCIESCVRCGDCFGPVPLYTLPPTYHGDFYDLLSWQSDYQACDELQLHCSTGERFALREMGHVDSSLTQRGREICRKLEAGSGKPVYYRLHRYYGRSARLERERRCPACDGCRLMSQMADMVNGRHFVR